MGMSLLCKYIKNNTDCKVILTGEVSDELFGYKYTDYAPSSTAFQRESEKRIGLHNALEDCKFQARKVQKVYRQLGIKV